VIWFTGVKNRLRMFRNILKRSSFVSRHGLRTYSETVGSSVSKPVLSDVSEDDIEAMFAYSAKNSSISENWTDAMEVIKKSEEVFPLDKPTEDDLLKIRATRPTMTLTSLVHESRTLQNLVDLGVGLYEWDFRGKLPLAAKLDFHRDVAPLIRLLADVGVPPDGIAEILTHNPELIEEELVDIKTRLNYLASKNFTKKEIISIVTVANKWLNFPVKIIDARLGFFQKTFELTGNEVRKLTVSSPRLISWHKTPSQVRQNIFSLNEEMGFTRDELKQMVLECPFLLLKLREKSMLQQFELLHNVIGYPHETLALFPSSLLCDFFVTQPRHLFLVSLGRDQYSPLLPNYVNPGMLTGGEDKEFAEDVAKVNVGLFNQFMKTL